MLEHLTTEARNPASEDLDGLSALEIVQLINSEDSNVAAAVALETDAIAKAKPSGSKGKYIKKVTVPAMDAGSKEGAYFTVEIEPQSIAYEEGDGRKIQGSRNISRELDVMQPEPPLFTLIERMQIALIVGMVMALLLSLLGSWVAAYQVTTPLQAIRNSARSISEGKFEEKIRVTSRAAEFQDLAKSLNRMSDSFRAQIEELATGEFIRRKDNLVLVGQSGVGPGFLREAGESNRLAGAVRAGAGRHHESARRTVPRGHSAVFRPHGSLADESASAGPTADRTTSPLVTA